MSDLGRRPLFSRFRSEAHINRRDPINLPKTVLSVGVCHAHRSLAVGHARRAAPSRRSPGTGTGQFAAVRRLAIQSANRLAPSPL